MGHGTTVSGTDGAFRTTGSNTLHSMIAPNPLLEEYGGHHASGASRGVSSSLLRMDGAGNWTCSTPTGANRSACGN